jgi:origin recognition complex subunit 3
MGRLLDCLSERLRSDGLGEVVVLESGHAPNLKTTLKNVIRYAVTSIDGNDQYQNIWTGWTVILTGQQLKS